PALMVTDTAPFRYPWYHTAEDTPDRICYEPFAHVVDGLEHVAATLAGGL
ncbi:MAG: aminopeptidase, partial [Acidobacteria bacterium]|nr:aminopeptidase [Acidobacteriota bacterium]